MTLDDIELEYSRLLAQYEDAATVRILEEATEVLLIRNGVTELTSTVRDVSVAVTQNSEQGARVSVSPGDRDPEEFLLEALGAPTRADGGSSSFGSELGSAEIVGTDLGGEERELSALTVPPSGDAQRELRVETIHRRVAYVGESRSQRQSFSSTHAGFRSTKTDDPHNHFVSDSAFASVAELTRDLEDHLLPRVNWFHGLPRLDSYTPPSDSLVFLPGDIAAQLVALLSKSFSAEATAEGRSRFAGLVGSRVGAAGLSMIDDPLLGGAPKHATFDDEGTEATRKPLVEAGVLRNYLGSSATAKLGVATGGNAWQPDRTSAPRVAGSNLYIAPGSGAISPAVGTIEVVQSHGLHMANEITGAFSMGASVIVHGESGPAVVNGLSVAGNVIDMLHEILLVGDRLQWSAGSVAYYGSPDLLVAGLAVGG